MYKFLIAATPLLLAPALLAQGTSEGSEPNNTIATAAFLGEGLQGFGDIDVTGTDVDWFKITLASASDLKVWTGPGFVGQIGDTRVRIYAADGITQLIDVDDGNFTTHGFYTTFSGGPYAAGDYYVAVRGFNALTSGSYTLDVVRAAPGTYASTYPALTPVAESVEVNDPRVLLGVATVSAMLTLNSGLLTVAGAGTSYTSLTADYDFYQINVTAPGIVQMETIVDPSAPLPTTLDTVIHFADSTFAQLAFNDDGGAGALSLLTYNVTVPGTYYVVVSGWGALNTGNYSLRITPPPAPLPTGVATTTIAVGGCLGTAGIPNLTNRLSTTGTGVRPERAVLGSQFWLDATNLPANAPLVRVAGFSALNPPFDLTSSGAPGCFVEVDPLFVLFALADSAGVHFWNLDLPMNVSFIGVTLEQQIAVLDPAANALGVTTSNRVSSVFGITH